MQLTDDDGVIRQLQYDDKGNMETIISEQTEEGKTLHHPCTVDMKGKIRIKKCGTHVGNIDNYFNKADEDAEGFPEGRLYIY